jgi:2-dehydro-3-deoxyphosphooctonate aldolase (KDO 8-P synthase)
MNPSAKTLLLIAGPCLAESEELVMEVANHLTTLCKGLPVTLYFKASYKKANRTSAGSFEGIGTTRALQAIASVRQSFSVPVLTDIHTEAEAEIAAQYVDVLQIPAFLSRQTSLLTAAAATGKTVNIKKAQFMAPEDVVKAAEKVVATGNNAVWLTERGTSFGYHDLVVDMRGLVTMSRSGFPVIFDATHSVQQPSIGAQSGGKREFIPALARAAAAVGIDGLFVETHPNVEQARSDSATQLPLKNFEAFLHEVLEIWQCRQQQTLELR